MIATAEQAHGREFTSTERSNAGFSTKLSRYNATPKLAEIQQEMHAIAMDGSLKPQARTAAALAFVKLEERRRLNLGKANPAPIKSESRKAKRGQGPVAPAPRVAEPSQDHDTADNTPGPLSGTVLRQVISKETGLPAIEPGPSVTPERPPKV